MAGLATDQLQRPVNLAVDLRAQYALREELAAARDKFKAKAAAGVIADVNTGEIIAMVSEPDFDPNNPRIANDPDHLNRLTTGVYEMGSTFKALTLAMALDSGRISLSSSFDARVPLRYGKFEINDFHEIVLAIVGGLFVLEAVSVIVQVVSYKLTGKRVFKMAPIHHHYEQLGWTESQIVIRFWIVAVVLALAGLATLKLR